MESPVMDMMAVKIEGPTLVFFRPRHPMPREATEGFAAGLRRFRERDLAGFEHVKFLVIPHDFDVLVMGDVELERAGLARLTTSETA